MCARLAVLGSCLLLAFAAAAETVYKYRGSDGRMVYSDRRLGGLELIESFEYSFPEAAPASPDAAQKAAEREVRINRYLAALQAAWTEVQEANAALAAAEARLRAGVGPQDDEGIALAGPAKPAAPAVGGPQAPTPPAAGGPAAAAPPAVGGPLGTRRGGGRSAGYAGRMQDLETEVQAARTRLEAALRRYNGLR